MNRVDRARKKRRAEIRKLKKANRRPWLEGRELLEDDYFTLTPADSLAFFLELARDHPKLAAYSSPRRFYSGGSIGRPLLTDGSGKINS